MTAKKKIAAFIAAVIFLFNTSVEVFAATNDDKNSGEYVNEPFAKEKKSGTTETVKEKPGKKKVTEEKKDKDKVTKEDKKKEKRKEKRKKNQPEEVTEPDKNKEPETQKPVTPQPTEPEKPQPTSPTTVPEIPEGEGLEFLVYDKNGVMAFAVIAAHEQYKLQPILAKGQISGRDTLMHMTQNLSDIALVNAGYFFADGAIIGVTKIDGTIVSSDDFYRSAIGIREDGSTFFGRVRYEGKIIHGDKEFQVSGVNHERVENSIIIYNPSFAATSKTNDAGLEIVVRGDTVSEVISYKGNNPIPRNGYIISAHGNSIDLLGDIQVGDKIILEEHLVSEDADFDSALHVIGAGPRLVKDNQIFVTSRDEQFPSDISVGRAPRSAVGVTKYGDFILAVVDGRQAHSAGCTLEEWANILRNEFGAVNAINLDGGGSTELVVKDSLVNSPSDGSERAVGNAIAILPK